jgi:formamidopyrimidine-DNA glycosylase
MTGQLIFKNTRGKTLRGGHPMEEERFIKFSISFANGSTLLLNDPRRLAYVKILDENKLAALKKENGVDPLNNKFTFSMFKELLARRPNEKIKLALMNQSLIAGIGNMYANEICFAAKISPLRQNKKLTESEKKNLYAAIKKILAAATRLQMNDKEFDFKVYQRDGEKCRRCKGTVKRTVIDGRGTFFCPLCQK